MPELLATQAGPLLLANSTYTVGNLQSVKDDWWRRTYSHFNGLVSDNSMLELLAVARGVAENLPE